MFDSETAIYLANFDVSKIDSKQGFAWTSMTCATFDLGAIALDAANIGCIWVEDED